MSYEVIKNNRPTGVIIEAKSAIEASIKYMAMPQDKSQYNVACVSVWFKEVETLK